MATGMRMIDLTESAVIDPTGAYRFWLRRPGIGLGATAQRVVWVMLNPSTATADVNDATIRKIVKFSRTWGYADVGVVNLFPFRARNPGRLVEWANSPARYAPLDYGVIGSGAAMDINAAWLRAGIEWADVVVAAWGAHAATMAKVGVARFNVESHARKANRDVMCLGRNADGSPKHPLYLRDDTPLTTHG